MVGARRDECVCSAREPCQVQESSSYFSLRCAGTRDLYQGFVCLAAGCLCTWLDVRLHLLSSSQEILWRIAAGIHVFRIGIQVMQNEVFL